MCAVKKRKVVGPNPTAPIVCSLLVFIAGCSSNGKTLGLGPKILRSNRSTPIQNGVMSNDNEVNSIKGFQNPNLG